jgi:MarR family transcriptional regulator, transcriptional regulator for hemolysin
MSSPKTSPTANPNRTFGYVLKDTSKLYVQRFEERARELGLTLPQCKALVYLARSEGISQVELASSAEIDPMSMVRILDRMELDGWVERRADPNDRRARRLYLQPKAKPLLEAVDRVSLATRDEALQGFSDQEAEALFTALDRVRHNIAALQPLPQPAAAAPKKAVRARTGE